MPPHLYILMILMIFTQQLAHNGLDFHLSRVLLLCIHVPLGHLETRNICNFTVFYLICKVVFVFQSLWQVGRGGAGKPLKCHFICLLCILHLYFHLYLSQFLNLYLYLQLYIFYVTRAEVTQTSLHLFALYLHFHLYLSLFLFIFVFAIVHILCDKSGKLLKHHYICSSVCFVFSFSYASLLVSMFVILFACICICICLYLYFSACDSCQEATQMSLYMFVSLFCIFIGLSYFVICICMFICICISVHVILCDFMIVSVCVFVFVHVTGARKPLKCHFICSSVCFSPVLAHFCFPPSKNNIAG